MKLKFPPLSGGITQGLNDAGIETFEGDYAHYVVRECGQNSLDAASSLHEPVEIEIAMRFVRAQELAFIAELRDTLDRCAVFWRDDEKAKEFFERANRLANAKDVALLRISDFGTTGVPGGDDEMNSPWFGLVRSRGVSVKRDEASAGAFGIGKDAPLAASSFRTVIYSTRTDEGKVAVQGICRLATHHDDTKSPTQGTGFIGNYSHAKCCFSALRREHDIPSTFHREKPGLDVWIVGFQAEVGEWEDDFVAAALRNFWPAIHFQKLKLRVGQQTINQKTLPHLMERFRRNKESVREAYPYFRAVAGAGGHFREQELSLAGDCRLHVQLGAHDLPRKVCMTRKTGMVTVKHVPNSLRSAGRELRLSLAHPLEQLSRQQFVRAWSSVAYLFPGLHPDGYEDAESGWPPALSRFAAEAWRRADSGELTDQELYCCDAQWSGLYDRMHSHSSNEMFRRFALAADYGESFDG